MNTSCVGSCSEDTRLVLRILENLVKVGRFDMTILFLTAKDKTGQFLFLNLFSLSFYFNLFSLFFCVTHNTKRLSRAVARIVVSSLRDLRLGDHTDTLLLLRP